MTPHAAVSALKHTKVLWDGLTQMCPQYGYFLIPPKKTWLIVKKDHYEEAFTTFVISVIQLTRLGRRYLGSAKGQSNSRSFCEDEG